MFYIQKSFRPHFINYKLCNHVRKRDIGWFAKIPMAPPDAIFGVVEEFKKDPSDKKVNLTVGVYRSDDNKPYVLKCVRKAEEIILKQNLDKDYEKMEGSEEFNQYSLEFAFGKDSEYLDPARNVTFQALSGCGGLSLAAQFLRRFYPGPKVVYISDPTWANHHNIFGWMGLKTKTYRYYDKKKIALDFKGMMEDIKCMPKKSIILFHASAHNPTGFDPSPEQWGEIADLVKKRQLYVIMDNAYQGFATGDFDQDACGFRLFAQKQINMVLVTSYAKNMALYGERVGATIFLVDCKEEAEKIMSHMLLLIRANHSNPPLQGGRIVTEIFRNCELREMWHKEVKKMANRVVNARKQLIDGLKKAGSKKNWDFIGKQIGMFSYSGLNPAQVERLKKEFHVYLLKSGRIAMCGINSKNFEYVAKAIHTVTSK